MEHIRPHQIFRLVDSKSCNDRVVKIVLPPSQVPSEPMLLDTAILLALARVVNARTVFELGTYVGIMTLDLAMNLPPDARLYTLDLDPGSFSQIKHQQHQEDREISEIYLKEDSRPAFSGTPCENKITRLFGDSNEFDFGEFQGKVDMVYVDGGHDLRTVQSDTENALKMLPADSMSCLAWHDYENPSYPDLTRYLKDLSNRLPMYHVEETMICFYLKNAPSSLTGKLIHSSLPRRDHSIRTAPQITHVN